MTTTKPTFNVNDYTTAEEVQEQIALKEAQIQELRAANLRVREWIIQANTDLVSVNRNKLLNGLVEIFTDGSSDPNPGPSGYAAIVVYKMHLHPHVPIEFALTGNESFATCNQMELRAVIAGLTYVQDTLSLMVDKPTEVLVTTDSKYVKDGITQWIVKWKSNGWKTAKNQPVKNKDLWVELDRLVSGETNIFWAWTKSHAGHKFNEFADKLAKEASKIAKVRVNSVAAAATKRASLAIEPVIKKHKTT
jgi:ribonuclease HI